MQERKIKELKKSLEKAQRKVSYYKGKVDQKNEKLEEWKATLEEEKKSLNKKLTFVEKREKEFEELQILLESDTMTTFAEGRFSNEIRELVIELYACNVSLNRVNDVNKAVVKKFTKKKISRLPSKGLLSRFFVKARYLADKQIGEAMLKGTDLSSCIGNTLHSDGASKFHKHYEGFQVTTPEGETMSLGILEMSSGTAESLVEAITEKLTAIASSMQSIDAKDTTEKLVSSIKNTLSDKTNVNPAFNTLFENLHKEVLPKYCEKWDLMNAEEQKNVLEMGHFFCRIHLLVNFAEESNKVLMKFEEACLEGKS